MIQTLKLEQFAVILLSKTTINFKTKNLIMSIKKQYLKSKPVCKVTFKISEDSVKQANSVHILGDFNNWKLTHPMKKLKNGSFTQTIDFEKGKEYQFRYLANQKNWFNENETDKSVKTQFGDSENSVIVI